MRALSASGTIGFRIAKVDVSQERWEEALEIARELGDDLWIARLLSDLGTAAAVREEWEPATELLNESADLFRELDVPPGWRPCSATSATSPASKETMRARSK